MNCIGIIPARYSSSRLPGKALAMIGGKPMIQHVYERARNAVEDLWVATDDCRILDTVKNFGGNAIMTSPTATSGTARCAEAFNTLGSNASIVINIQGDEPFLNPDDIHTATTCFEDPDVEIATLARRFDPAEGFESLFCSDNPKVVMDRNMNALYFSRSIIPYVRDYPWQDWHANSEFYIHVGLYAFRSETLRRIVSLPDNPLEKAERLEQLRWLGAGIKIRIALTDSTTISVDTPADLEKANRHYSCLGLNTGK